MTKTKKSKKNHETENSFSTFYKKNYKKLMIIPILLLLFSCISIYLTIQKESTPIYRDVSLKGGLSAIINTQNSISEEDLKLKLEENFPQNSFIISELFENGIRVGFIVDTDLDEEKFMSFMNNLLGEQLEFGKNYSSNYISATLSNSFFIQAMYILAISLFLMSIVIFLYFREFVPSFAVVLSAIFDLIVTVGILDFFEFHISIAGIGALLMLIGYSIDTDVLLTNRLIKEFGDNYFEKTFYAFKTGSLMSLTTLAAGLVAIIITSLANSTVIFEISLILVVGLLVDYISTWLQNTGILLWWLEIKNK